MIEIKITIEEDPIHGLLIRSKGHGKCSELENKIAVEIGKALRDKQLELMHQYNPGCIMIDKSKSLNEPTQED